MGNVSGENKKRKQRKEDTKEGGEKSKEKGRKTCQTDVGGIWYGEQTYSRKTTRRFGRSTEGDRPQQQKKVNRVNVQVRFGLKSVRDWKLGKGGAKSAG